MSSVQRIYLRAPPGSPPATLDAAARTVSARAVTLGAPIDMGARTAPDGSAGPWALQLDPAGLIADRFTGAPVLTQHGSTEVLDQVGVVLSHRIEADGLVVVVQFGERDLAAQIFTDVSAGVLRAVSIGLNLLTYELAADMPPAEGSPGTNSPDLGDPRLFIATSWQPIELTIVSIGADPSALFLAYAPPAGVAPDREFLAALHARAVAADINPEEILTMTEVPMPSRQELNNRLQTAVAAQFPPIFAGMSNGQADPRVSKIDRMADALASRAMGAKPSASARDFMGLSVVEMARICLQDSGAKFSRFDFNNPARVIELSHSTSDFPLLTQSVAQRLLIMGYERAPAAIKSVAALRSDIRDFRDVTAIRFGGVGRLTLTPEAGSVVGATVVEAGESYHVRTYARRFVISREAMTNDDLSAFTEASIFGGAAAETEAAELVAMLAANSGAGPTMRDTLPLFRTAANNLAFSGAGGGSVAALDVTNVASAVALMRRHTDPAGNLVAAQPDILLVGASRELAARQLLSAVTAGTLANVNPYTAAFTLVVEPRITGTEWYLFSDPDRVRVLELGTLAGTNGAPKVEVFTEAATLGLTFRVVHDFGIGVVGRAGCWKNPGFSA